MCALWQVPQFCYYEKVSVVLDAGSLHFSVYFVCIYVALCIEQLHVVAATWCHLAMYTPCGTVEQPTHNTHNSVSLYISVFAFSFNIYAQYGTKDVQCSSENVKI